MKIVHVGKFYPPALGGIETHLHGLAEGQARHGHDVSVVCMQHAGTETSCDRTGGVTVHRLRRRISFAKLDWLPDFSATMRGLEADVIHVHVPNPSAILGVLRARPDAPILVTYHSDNVAQKVRGQLFRLAERPFYDRAHRILATSEAYIEGSVTLRRHRQKTIVVPLGIDTSRFGEANPEVRSRAEMLRKQHGAPLWFACGRLVPYKGFDVAIRALVHAPGKLLLAGDGPRRSALEQQASRCGVGHRIEFMGRIDDETRNACLLACDAFWFPSVARNEAFGLAQVEAMAAGKPVINCNIPHSGVAWVSEHAVSGLTVPVHDAIAFAEAARRLADDADLRARLASGARERARALFDQERVIAQVTSAYSQVTNGAGE